MAGSVSDTVVRYWTTLLLTVLAMFTAITSPDMSIPEAGRLTVAGWPTCTAVASASAMAAVTRSPSGLTRTTRPEAPVALATTVAEDCPTTAFTVETTPSNGATSTVSSIAWRALSTCNCADSTWALAASTLPGLGPCWFTATVAFC